MQNFNLSNYFPLLLIFGLSAASWIYGAIRQQAKRKRARAAARSRFEEQLRTGRSEEPTQGPKAAPMSQAQKLAARRQAQLQRLRAATSLSMRDQRPFWPQDLIHLGTALQDTM